MVFEGDRVPEFELNDSDGRAVKSTDFAGRMHVIYFYPKDFTPGCTREADEFSRDHGLFEKEGIDIIGISPDGTESHKKFCGKMGIKYTLLSDTEKKASTAFGVWGMKKFMGREYMGVVRSTFLVNKEGIIFKAYSKVKPAGHSKDVLEDFLNQK